MEGPAEWRCHRCVAIPAEFEHSCLLASEREGGVWMRFALRLTRAGLPDLRITGDHTVYFHGGRICRIEEYVPTPVGKAVDAYLAAHDAALKPHAGETSTAPLVRLAV